MQLCQDWNCAKNDQTGKFENHEDDEAEVMEMEKSKGQRCK